MGYSQNIKYKVEFRKNRNWPIILFLGLFNVILIVVLLTIIYGLIEEPEYFDDITFFIILMFITGFFTLDRFIWMLNGKESLIISDKILIMKSGKILKSQKQIEFNEFESIYYDDDRTTPFINKVYGLSGGKIVIKYLGRQTRIGQDLQIKLAEIIVDEIRNLIK